MDIPSSSYAAIGAITAATIAGGISFIVSVLAKDQKTSEFRQAWIDGLRDDIAELISIFFVMSDIGREMVRAGKTKEQIVAYFVEKDDHFCKLEMTHVRIQLRINPSEHDKLLTALSTLKAYVSSSQILDSKAADAIVDDLVKESRLILKREWKRVKRGEPVFVATKAISLLVLITALSLGAAYACGHLHIELLP